MATDVIYDLHVSEPTTKLGTGERVGWAWLNTDVRCDLHVRVAPVSNVGTGERVGWVWLLTLKCDLHVLTCDLHVLTAPPKRWDW